MKAPDAHRPSLALLALRSRSFGPVWACALLSVGCAAGVQPQGSPPAHGLRERGLPEPKLVDQSLVCGQLDEPTLKFHVQPDYTEDLRRDHVQGEVVVEAIITKEGAVRDPRVVRASDPRLGDTALAAVAQSRYTPAKCDGVPAEMVFQTRLRFWLF